MSHANARLNLHGRRLLVRRVREQGMPIAHVARGDGDLSPVRHSMGRPVRRRGRGRPCRPVVAAAVTCRLAPARRSNSECSLLERSIDAARTGWAPSLGVAPRTVGRILRRHRVPRLCCCDPMTGEVIRASKTTAVRYERDRPGELVHMDVKKIGRIPDGGGWRAHGREMGSTGASKRARIGYDYVHSVVDDHSRFAYSEILGDETAATCSAFFARAIEHLRGRWHRPHRRGHDRQRTGATPTPVRWLNCSPSRASNTS